MRAAKKIAAAGIVVLCLHYLYSSGWLGEAQQWTANYIAERRAAVSTVSDTPVAEAPEETDPVLEAVPPSPSPSASTVPSKAESAVVTTIAGGLKIKNETKYDLSVSKFLNAGPSIKLQAGKPQILIIHTHSSEAYAPAGLDKYEDSDTNRTEDKRYSVIRVGDELTDILEKSGLSVIHDREIYDYPSYTGSYARSGEAVEKHLKEYPTIKIVIDLHRDALGAGDVVYKTMAEEDGVCASQVMLLTGTDESGLKHPNWRENLKLALYLQDAVSKAHPTLMRPVDVVPQRYNQQLSTGSLLVEVGSSGNTLQEALAGVRLFGNAAGPALAKLVE